MLNEETLTTIAAEVEAVGLSEQTLAVLRSGHPDIHFTYCMDDDVGVHEPYANRAGFNLYLVDGREHCLKFTADISHATGLVLAEVIEDD